MPGAVWVVFGLIALCVVLLLQFRWHWYPLPYLYFLRFPIVLAGLLFLSPLAAVGVDPGARPMLVQRPFHNLFVLNPVGLFLVPFLATLTSWTIVNAARWIYAHTPDRLGLTFWGFRGSAGSAIGPARVHRVSSDAGSLRYALYALPAAPLVACATWASPGALSDKLVLVVPSLAIAFGVRWLALSIGPRVRRVRNLAALPASTLSRGAGLVQTLLGWVARQPVYRRFEAFLVDRVFGERSVERERGGGADPASLELTNANLWRFFSVTLVVYAVLGWFLWPGRESWGAVALQGYVPALAYVLLFVMLLTWVLSWFSLQLDRYRVPAELAIVLAAALVYRLPFTDTDHYYRVEHAPGNEPVEPVAYLRAWNERRPGADPVVVTGSGGGISASAWVATVLAGLQDPALFGDDFARSVALVSTTSGGSVGAMYYVDGFEDAGPGAAPRPPGDPAWIVQMASRSSLGAMAWGLVYPDFVRLLFPPLAGGSDRGWALERRWAQPMPDDERNRRLGATLRGWSEGVAAGWRPAQVFNATFTETGGRFLISPLVVRGRPRDAKPEPEKRKPWQGRDFAELYRDADLSIVTAARLSATFPFVTPVARPSAGATGVVEEAAYHVADGGYFDNFGVMSAIEFIRDVLPVLEETRRRALVLEIRLGDSTRDQRAVLGEGFRMEVIGPAETLMAVRNTSQLERNDLELQLLRRIAPDRVYPKPVVFELRTDTPLSWHLSDDESRRICAYWMARCPHNQTALERIADFLGRPAPTLPAAAKSLQPLCTQERAEVPADFDCPWLDDRPEPSAARP